MLRIVPSVAIWTALLVSAFGGKAVFAQLPPCMMGCKEVECFFIFASTDCWKVPSKRCYIPMNVLAPVPGSCKDSFTTGQILVCESCNKVCMAAERVEATDCAECTDFGTTSLFKCVAGPGD